MINETAQFDLTLKNVLICDTQPVAVEGMKWLIRNSGDLRFAGVVSTLDAVYDVLNPEEAKAAASEKAKLADEAKAAVELAALEMEVSSSLDCGGAVGETVDGGMAAAIEPSMPESPEPGIEAAAEPEYGHIAELLFDPIIRPVDAVVIDKGLGFAGVMELLQKLTSTSHPTPAVIWGASISEAEALRLLQAGARGILRRTSESGTLLTCLRAVTAGGTWMEDGIFGSAEKLFNPKRSELTHREREVVVLVEKGLRNSDIAGMLGIRTGTVKIHLKHIFEKTGVRGRYGLAFTGLQNKGSIALTAPPHFTA